MKPRILLTALMIVMITGTIAQKPTITLTFTADDNGQHVPLNSILIENLTQGGDTTLYAPDTVIVLDYITGINDNYDDNSFSLFQNYPNPMRGKTTICLRLSESENVVVTVIDVMGRKVVNQEFQLEQGTHTFSFYPGRESLYFFTARADEQSRTIKMFNSPIASTVMEFCKLEYNGTKTGSGGYKAGVMLNNFVFALGDQLQYTASSALGDQAIIDTPSGNQTYTFQYGSGGAPCPGMPTVTDIDGNTYNTVQIGDQCWMKENLKTTTYRNGTAIPNVTDGYAWNNLTTGAYVWYDNNISWKESYGALYNWFAIVDPNGLCLTGWHVPSDDEWTALTDFIGGTASPHGNELKSCRQVDSPLGGGCNTSEHPRWEEDINYGNYGTDDYGFSGLPGSGRYYGGLFGIFARFGYWWSSTEGSSGSAWERGLGNSYGNVGKMEYDKRSGFSVRCLRDEGGSTPGAAFTADPTSGTAPLIVDFIDQSMNNPTTWQWDFGDGGTSTQQNPEYTFDTPGTYTVQLTVTNNFGSDTEIKNNFIIVEPLNCGDSITDIDGNVYNTVLIGNQCWMKENLKTTTYINGTAIPNVTDAGAWSGLTSSAYVWYNNDIGWKDSYGALYNWYATVDANSLCPAGWHVPTNDDWTALTDFIGGTGSPHGNELKSCRQINSPLGGNCNTSEHPRWVEDTYSGNYGTDDYGFSGLPGGARTYYGAFYPIGGYGSWWSSMEYSSSYAWVRCLNYDYGSMAVGGNDKQSGYSVRCLRDD